MAVLLHVHRRACNGRHRAACGAAQLGPGVAPSCGERLCSPVLARQPMPRAAQGNPDIRRWMAENGVGDIRALLDMFEGRVLDLAAAAGRAYIVWQARPISTEAARRERDSVLCCWSGDAVPLLLKAAVLHSGPGRRALPRCSIEPCVTARLSALNLAACATLLERQITQSTYRTCLSSSVAARVLARSHRPGASPASERTPAP